MRRIASAMILSLLITSSAGAFAASRPALAPGNPAGIKQAQEQDVSTPLLVVGAAAIGIGIALAVADNDDATPGTPPTTTTTTTTAP